jgi:lipopolysaccharide transport system ATP-binding protein
VGAVTGGKLNSSQRGNVSVKALDGISLEIKSGDRLGIVGHNGSGKSTLLRLLSGIYEPTSGAISRAGSIASLVDIGLGISPESSGIENIKLRGALMGISKKHLQKNLDDIVTFSGLGDFIHLPVRTYSSGMLLRLAFAVATSVEAEILIMDEWLSVGDDQFVALAQERLQRLINKAEILIVASHSKTLIEQSTTTTLWLEHGLAKEIGSSQEVCQQYFR